MKIEHRRFNDLQEFILATTLPSGSLFNHLDGFVFRGESSSKYHLIPSALRLEKKSDLWRGLGMPIDNQSEWEQWQIHAEYEQLRHFFKTANNSGLKVPKIDSIFRNYVDAFPMEFIARHGHYTWLSSELAELAALAQHYGLPTRLLDWSFDMNVALYFASTGAIRKQLKPSPPADDTMVIWALNAQYIQFLQPTVSRIPLQFVVPAYADNPNLNAQKGVLSYWEVEMRSSFEEVLEAFKNGTSPRLVDRTPLDALLEEYCRSEKNDNVVLLYKFEIPVNQCADTYKYIRRLGYSAASMFPGYNGAAKELAESPELQEAISILSTQSQEAPIQSVDKSQQ